MAGGVAMLKIKPLKKIKQQGFTLVEIALAVLLISLLLGGSLAITGAFRDLDQQEQVEEQLSKISKAMEVYLAVNKHLPCPDTDGNGRENRHSNGVQCASDAGALPFVDLAVVGKDPWNNAFAYKVNERVDVISHHSYITDICQPASIFGRAGVPTSPSAEFAFCPTSATYFCRASRAPCSVNWDFVRDPRQTTPPFFNFATQPIGAEAFDSLNNNPSDPDPRKNLILFATELVAGNPVRKAVDNSIVAMVVSYGENGWQAWNDCSATNPMLNAIEVKNCNEDRVFERALRGKELNFFTWMTLNEAKQVMIQSGGF